MGNRCYLPATIFEVSAGNYKRADRLQYGDSVQSSAGKTLRVAFHEIHLRQQRKLVTLGTAQAELTVTHDHRIQGPGGITAASDLQVGDLVMCGDRSQSLAKVKPFNQVTEVVEIRFDPDDPVQTRLAPRWGIETLGAEQHWTENLVGPLQHWTENGVGPVGPTLVEPQSEALLEPLLSPQPPSAASA